MPCRLNMIHQDGDSLCALYAISNLLQLQGLPNITQVHAAFRAHMNALIRFETVDGTLHGAPVDKRADTEIEDLKKLRDRICSQHTNFFSDDVPHHGGTGWRRTWQPHTHDTRNNFTDSELARHP